MVTQLCEWTKIHWIVHFKRVNFICEFCLNKKCTSEKKKCHWLSGHPDFRNINMQNHPTNSRALQKMLESLVTGVSSLVPSVTIMVISLMGWANSSDQLSVLTIVFFGPGVVTAWLLLIPGERTTPGSSPTHTPVWINLFQISWSVPPVSFWTLTDSVRTWGTLTFCLH